MFKLFSIVEHGLWDFLHRFSFRLLWLSFVVEVVLFLVLEMVLVVFDRLKCLRC